MEPQEEHFCLRERKLYVHLVKCLVFAETQNIPYILPKCCNVLYSRVNLSYSEVQDRVMVCEKLSFPEKRP